MRKYPLANIKKYFQQIKRIPEILRNYGRVIEEKRLLEERLWGIGIDLTDLDRSTLEYQTRILEAESLRAKITEYESTLSERNKLINLQRSSIAELRRLYTEEKSTKIGTLLSLLNTSRRESLKERDKRSAVKLIVLYGLSCSDISKIVETQGTRGLSQKRANLINEYRKKLNKPTMKFSCLSNH